MHLLVYTRQVSWRLNDKIFSWVGVLYNLNGHFANLCYGNWSKTTLKTDIRKITRTVLEPMFNYAQRLVHTSVDLYMV